MKLRKMLLITKENTGLSNRLIKIQSYPDSLWEMAGTLGGLSVHNAD
jgi:hypothetical protein